MNENLFLKGTDRTITTYNDKLTITSKSLLNSSKETTLFYKNILSVEFKSAKGLSNGYLRLILQNSNTSNRHNLKSQTKDENTIFFVKSENISAEVIKIYIESKILGDEDRANTILSSAQNKTSNTEFSTNLKKPFYKKPVFWIIILFVIILGSCINNSSDKPSDKKNTNITKNNDSELSQEQLNNLYKMNVYDPLQKVLTTYDELLLTWQATMTSLGNEEIDTYTAYSQIDELNKSYSNLKRRLLDIKEPDFLNEEQSESFKNMKENIDLALFMWQESTNTMKKMLDTEDISNSKIKKIEDNIKDGDSYLIKGLAYKIELDSVFGINQNN